MFRLFTSTELSTNERRGASVVKWPAVSANGSNAYGKRTKKHSLVALLHNRLQPNCISW